MPFPVPELHLNLVSAPPSYVRPAAREDVLWNRPVFTAPPLEAFLPVPMLVPVPALHRPDRRPVN